MYEHSDFVNLATELASNFNLAQDKIHENIITLYVEGAKEDIVRLIYDANEKKIGFAFHVELMPTVAIQLFSYAFFNCITINLSAKLNFR